MSGPMIQYRSYSQGNRPRRFSAFLAMRRLFLACAALILLGLPPLAAQETYRLGPGDTISLRVVGWNAFALEFQEYRALQGDYVVGQTGYVTLPLLGAVRAAGVDVTTLGELLSDQYRSRLGVVEPPSATVAVIGYRPVFVIGDVSQPGRYDYSPGLTAVHAMALAGGVRRPGDQFGNASTATRIQGQLEELRNDVARERMRRARLLAEMAGEDTFERPGLPIPPGGEETQDALYEHERSLFESRRERMERSLSSLEDSRKLLVAEIAALEGKLSGMERQVAMVRESVGNLETLRDRGLARSPTLVTLQRTLIDLESRELDTETNLYAARQQMSELDRDRNDMISRRQLEVLRDLQKAEAQIERFEVRQITNRQLLADSQALLTQDEQDIQTQIIYTILRPIDGVQERIAAEATTPLGPMDVLEIDVRTTFE